jgi:DNA-binding phage protein
MEHHHPAAPPAPTTQPSIAASTTPSPPSRAVRYLTRTIGAVQENIDTITPGGRLVFHVFGALASFERELIQERTLAGLKQARKMIGEKTPVTEVARVLGVSRATLYRRVPELGEARRPVSPSSAPGAESIFSVQA